MRQVPQGAQGLAFPGLCTGKAVQRTVSLGQLIVKLIVTVGWPRQEPWQLRAQHIEHTKKKIDTPKIGLFHVKHVNQIH